MTIYKRIHKILPVYIFIALVLAAVFSMCSLNAFASSGYSIAIQPSEGSTTNTYSICMVSNEKGVLNYDNFDWDTIKSKYGWESMTDAEIIQALNEKITLGTGEEIGFVSNCVKNYSGSIKNNLVPVSVDAGSYVLVSDTSCPLICGLGIESSYPNVVIAEKNDNAKVSMLIRDWLGEYRENAFLGQDKVAHCLASVLLPRTFMQYDDYPLNYEIAYNSDCVLDNSSVKIVVDNDVDISSLANVQIEGNKIIVKINNLRDTTISEFAALKDGSKIGVKFDLTMTDNVESGVVGADVASTIEYRISPTSTQTAFSTKSVGTGHLTKLIINPVCKEQNFGLANISFKISDLDNKYLLLDGTFGDELSAQVFVSDEQGFVKLPFNLGCGSYIIHQIDTPNDDLKPASFSTELMIEGYSSESEFNKTNTSLFNFIVPAYAASNLILNAEANGAGIVSDIDNESGVITVQIDHSVNYLSSLTQDVCFLISGILTLVLIASSVLFVLYKKTSKKRG